MSASREKRQRQDEVGDLTPKQRRDLDEAKQKKRNKVAYTLTGIVAVILVAALLVWDSGILKGNPVAATVGEQRFTASQVTYYYGSVRQSIASIANYGLISFDPRTKASAQTVDESAASTLSMFAGIQATAGSTYEELMESEALKMLQQTVLLCDQAAAEDYTLSEAGQKSVENSMLEFKTAAAQNGMSMKSFLTSYYGSYLTEKGLEAELTRTALASDYQANKLASFPVTDDELETYYQEHIGTMDTYDFRFAQIPGAPAVQTDANGETIEPTDAEKSAAMSQAKVKAEAMAEELKAGASFAATAAKYVSEGDAQLFRDDAEYNHQADALGSSLSGYIYGQWLTSTDEARKAGDIGVVEDQSGQSYYVVQLLGRWRAEDTYATVNPRHILIKAQLDEGATEPTEAQYEAAKAQIEDLKAQWEAGEKTAESFALLAQEHSQDPGSKENGGLYSDIRPDQFVPEFNDFIFAPGRQVGDVGIVKNAESGQQGYHLVLIDAVGDIAWQSTARTALQSDAYSAWYEEVDATYTSALVAEGMSAIAR